MIPMILHCPGCHWQHVDRDEWASKPHRTHLCARCGDLFKPANVDTVGVEFLSDEPDQAPDFVIDVGHVSRQRMRLGEPVSLDELAAASQFWSDALRLPIVDPNEDGLGKYAVLSDRSGVRVEIQMVGAQESGIHLDIQAKDVNAEVMRLERLGAVIQPAPGYVNWVIMQAPTGHRFCVIPRRR